MTKNAASQKQTKGEYSSDENTVKGNWSNKLDFVLALIGYSVGFGNVWRFPYLCYRNGGGAFLIPYFTMLILAGIPLYYMELLIGQYSSLGPIAVWTLSPLFKGLGIGAVIVTVVICLYYNTLVAYVIFYLFASMGSQVPWSTCDNPWNTPACRQRSGSISSAAVTNSTNMTMEVPLVSLSLTNATMLNETEILKAKSPAEEYFERYVLDLSSGIEEIGAVRWQLVLCLLLSWIIIFLVLIKGIKSVGKVVYFTATFPYIVLLILLVRGLTLPGSMQGLHYYLVPTWSKLASPKVWGDAAAQIFYSLGPAWGALISFASYNEFNNNILRDTLVCSLVCCGTSVLAGTVIFTIIGFMAHDLGLAIEDVMTSGPGLAFVAYPEALSRMPIAPLWAVIFFLMLFTAGIDTMFSQIEMIVVAVSDEFPNTVRKHKTLFTLAVCALYFLIGIPQVTRGGIYILTLVDWYIALFSVLVIGLLEVIVVAWIYGVKPLSVNAEVMLGRKPSIYFIVCWCFFTPAAIVAILIFNAVEHRPVVYNDYKYPSWAEMLGWIIAIGPIVPIPGYMIYFFITRKSQLSFGRGFSWTSLGQYLVSSLRPGKDWGPMMPANRRKAGLPPLEDTELPLTDTKPIPVDV